MRYLICGLMMSFIFSANAFPQSNYNSDNQSDTTYQAPDDSSDSGYDNYTDESTENPETNNLDSGDFRSASWGMTREQVRQIETAPLDSATQAIVDEKYDSDALCYFGQLADYSVRFEYGFKGDTLASGTYLFDISNSEDNLYFDDFAKVRQIMEKSYGPADYDSMTWTDATYEEDPSNWAYAIRIGNARKIAEWYTKNSEIFLELSEVNGKIILDLYYDDVRETTNPDSGNSEDDSGDTGGY